MTPYHLTRGEAGSWRIGFGASTFLVAQGSGFSIRHGRRLLRQLEDDWRQRIKSRRTMKRKKNSVVR